jgi:integrase/recombinase XerD
MTWGYTKADAQGRSAHGKTLAADGLAVQRDQVLEQYAACLAVGRYSSRTAKNYINAFRSFLAEIDPCLPRDLAKAEVEDWLSCRALSTGSSIAHQNTIINAIKVYYVGVENRAGQDYQFARPKREEVMPSPLSKEEVQLLLIHTENIKHRCLLLVAYSTGLKAKELLRLRSEDMRLDRMTIRVRAEGGRSRLDREVPLSPKLAGVLKLYFEQCSPRTWLFEGEQQGCPYSERSAQAVVRQAGMRAGIHRPITLLTLRDSYAIHQLEAGVALETVQDILGHGSIRSTARYAQVARKRLPASPADALQF